jgi:hypothetical protein
MLEHPSLSIGGDKSAFGVPQPPVNRAVRGRDQLLAREPRRNRTRSLTSASPANEVKRQRRRDVRSIPNAPRTGRGGRGHAAAFHAPSSGAVGLPSMPA